MTASSRWAGRRVALLTAATVPDLKRDEVLLARAFESAGATVETAIWSEPFRGADLTVIRSCWDYADRPAEFLAALDVIAGQSELWNPLETIRWNSDKRYLLELSQSGVAMPGTVLVERGESRTLTEVMRELSAGEVVVKPVVGAGGEDTWRATGGEEADWQKAVAREALLVQPYLPEVVSEGELSLLYFHGTFSHALIKRAAEGEFRVQETHGGSILPLEVTSAIHVAAERVLSAVTLPWQYARVDGVMVGGSFQLMEVEMIEPDLYLRTASGSEQRLLNADPA